MLASTLNGSTETTFYVLTLYLGAVGVRDMPARPGGLSERRLRRLRRRPASCRLFFVAAAMTALDGRILQLAHRAPRDAIRGRHRPAGSGGRCAASACDLHALAGGPERDRRSRPRRIPRVGPRRLPEPPLEPIRALLEGAGLPVPTAWAATPPPNRPARRLRLDLARGGAGAARAGRRGARSAGRRSAPGPALQRSAARGRVDAFARPLDANPLRDKAELFSRDRLPALGRAATREGGRRRAGRLRADRRAGRRARRNGSPTATS